MKVSGFLVPYPDIGAADLMDNNLRLEIQAPGPGRLAVRVTLPQTNPGEVAPARFARKWLEISQLDGSNNGGDWAELWSATTESGQAQEEVSVEVPEAGRLRCKLTNMSGMNGQFSLECEFVPAGES